MRVGAAETKGIHARTRRLPVGLGPVLPLRNAQPQIVERDLRVRILEVQARRYLAMLQAQYRFDQPRHARSRFEVTQIALDRADHATVLGFSCLSVDPTNRCSLDRVAYRCP